nr:DUF6444 domain-containing protein [Clostridium saccharobutylicum]
MKEQNVQIESLTSRVKSLESQVSKNSPSSDGFKKKTKSLRTKSAKKTYGQEGLEATALELSDNPDEIKLHGVDKCDICGESL